jgi:predicted acetyltransferase
MARLTVPIPEVRVSFVAAMAEFRAEGRGGEDDRTMIAWEMHEYGPRWGTPQGFAHYVRMMLAEALERTPRPAHFVPATTMWWVDGADYLGRIAIRHRLTPLLTAVGGHIGYDVRPTARRRGHATAMLRAALPVANALGIERALLTCDPDNVASRKVIEANGGVFEDRRGAKLRFWVPTRPR